MLFHRDALEISDIDDIHFTESQWKYIGGDQMIYVAEDIYSAIKN